MILTELKNKRPKIAVFRALKLGDLLCCVPALRSLRAAFPQSEISLIGLPWAQDFAERFNHLIDKFFEFPGYPGLTEKTGNLRGIVEFVIKMQEENFDLLIQMHGNGEITNHLIRALRAKLEAGYCKKDCFCPNLKTFMVDSDSQHEIKKHLKLMEFLGIKPQGTDLEFPIRPGEIRQFQQNIDKWRLEIGNYIVVHPGAQFKKRQWPAQNFACVADYLAAKGYQIVLTGVEKEEGTISEVLGKMSYPAVDLSGRTDLGQMGLLIKNAQALVANDTSVSHIAAAFKTPSVIVSYAKQPALWAPFNRDLHRVLPAQGAEDVSRVLGEMDLLLNINWKRGATDFSGMLNI